jgi:lysozyme
MTFCKSGFASGTLLIISLTACAPFNSGSSTPGGPTNNQSSITPPTPPNSTPATNPTPVPVVVTTPTPRPSDSPNQRICADSTTTPGTDVSDHDPGTDWPTVKTTQNFAIVKATEGVTFTNILFASDWAAIKNVGMIRGAYHYFHPNDDPTAQAEFFLKTVGTLGADDLPAILDWEISGGETAAVQISRALTWLQFVEAATGKTPMVYFGPSFYNSLGNPIEFARYPLYIANYDETCPDIPPPWTKWTFWQLDDQGSIDGIQSPSADLDQFNGSAEQLLQFANTGTY